MNQRIFVRVFAALALVFVLSGASAASPIHSDGAAFKDREGRVLILRGVNLGGSSKVPFKSSWDPRKVSFVGRPFPLSQADVNFRRLKSWGLTCVRLIVTWEAVEHAGPGQYDTAYLDYLRQLVKEGAKYGMTFFVDFHQDLYSRASGGDGAPFWTLTELGLQPDRTHEPGAPGAPLAGRRGYLPVTAGTFSADTLETLFWAGNDFAPSLEVDGIPVQDWLQDHYVDAMRQVALSLRGLNNVIGFDTYNEPAPGFLGVSDLTTPDPIAAVLEHTEAPGTRPATYWDLIQAASGFAPKDGTVPADRLWASGTSDLWRKYGVWDIVNGRPALVKPHYFAKVRGTVPVFSTYLRPLYVRIANTVQQILPGAMIFEEPPLFGSDDPKDLALSLPGMVSEPHWYDTEVLTRRYTPDTTYLGFWGKRISGRKAVLEVYVGQIRKAIDIAKAMGGIPTLIGETGIGYDMNGKVAYRTGDFSAQESLSGLMMEALDRCLASYTIWNYTADNSNAQGDHWNGEDFSIFSPDQRKNPADINSGGRALRTLVRPYARATAGTPLAMSFDPGTRVFRYRFEADPRITAATEIFVPRFQYPKGFRIKAVGARATPQPARSRALITGGHGDVTVLIQPK